MHLSPILRKATELGIGFTAIATLFLAGCGGGGGSSVSGNTPVSSVTTTITPFKGMFTSGTVSLKDVNGNLVTLVSGGSINSNGTASVTYPANVAYPLTVEVTGTFLDETSGVGATGTISAGAPLRGLIPAVADAQAASGVPVTVLTEFARTMLPSSGFSAASAVAAITDAASGVFGVATYRQAMLPPVFNAQGQTTDVTTLKLAALAHVINQQGTGANLPARLQNIASLLAAGSAVNAVIPQTTFNNALGVVNGGASSLLPVGVTPPTIPAFTLPGGALGNASSGGGGTGMLPPTIAGFSPTSGTFGNVITITGTNFGAGPTGGPKYDVKFNGVAASPTGVGATSMTVPVPAGATTGPITITTTSGAVTSSTNFTITGAATGGNLSFITITGTPTTGQQLILVMTGLTSTTASSYQVTFGGNVSTPATLVSVPAGVLYVTVPNGAVTGNLVVTDSGTGKTATFLNFSITQPPVAQAACTSNANVTTPLPASGVVGTNWSDCSKQAPNTASAWGKVIWDGTQFAALRSAGGVATSPDGYVWTSNAYATPFNDLAFNGSKWVGITTNSTTLKIFYSSGIQPNGWTLVTPTLTLPGTLKNAFAVNGRFFIGTNNGTFLTSTDGVTWTETAQTCGGSYLNNSYAGNTPQVLWDGAKYQIYIGAQYSWVTPMSCSSTDGVIWTGTNLTFSPAATGVISNSFTPAKVVWDGSKFTTFGRGNVWTSLNGIDWTMGGAQPAANAGLIDLIWTGSQFVAVGYDGNFVNQSTIFTSANGSTWTQSTATVPTGQTLSLNSIAFSPTLNRLVSMGYFTASGMFSGSAMFVSP